MKDLDERPRGLARTQTPSNLVPRRTTPKSGSKGKVGGVQAATTDKKQPRAQVTSHTQIEKREKSSKDYESRENN